MYLFGFDNQYIVRLSLIWCTNSKALMLQLASSLKRRFHWCSARFEPTTFWLVLFVPGGYLPYRDSPSLHPLTDAYWWLLSNGTFSGCQQPCWESNPATLEAKTSNEAESYGLEFSHALPWPAKLTNLAMGLPSLQSLKLSLPLQKTMPEGS